MCTVCNVVLAISPNNSQNILNDLLDNRLSLILHKINKSVIKFYMEAEQEMEVNVFIFHVFCLFVFVFCFFDHNKSKKVHLI